jgi:hypothetical protein
MWQVGGRSMSYEPFAWICTTSELTIWLISDYHSNDTAVLTKKGLLKFLPLLVE